MIGERIMRNGRLAPPSDASFGLDDVDVTYGYGCYETLKIRDGILYFPEFHEERLLRSAGILGIAHDIKPGDVVAALRSLSEANGVPSCNIKVMLIGRDGRSADWYAFMLPAVVPPEAAYSDGVAALLFRGERHFPAAKSLSMLLSTVAYRAAVAAGCYDALLVNGRGEITEGTRTNVFYARRGESDAVYTPPAADVLEGVTRRTLIAALAESGVRAVERPLLLSDALSGEFALALTSTSTRVAAISSLVDESRASRAVAKAPELDRVRAVYDEYLERYAGHDR